MRRVRSGQLHSQRHFTAGCKRRIKGRDERWLAFFITGCSFWKPVTSIRLTSLIVVKN